MSAPFVCGGGVGGEWWARGVVCAATRRKEGAEDEREVCRRKAVSAAE